MIHDYKTYLELKTRANSPSSFVFNLSKENISDFMKFVKLARHYNLQAVRKEHMSEKPYTFRINWIISTPTYTQQLIIYNIIPETFYSFFVDIKYLGLMGAKYKESYVVYNDISSEGHIVYNAA